ncbi:MAG: hypothetical protein ACRDZX_08210 [Acidimicrobiales bacterium]
MKGNEEHPGSANEVAWRARGGRRPDRPRGTLALAAVVAAAALGPSACGGGPSASPGVASVSPTTTGQPGSSGGVPSSSRRAAVGGKTTTSAVAGAVTTVPSPASFEEEMLRFAECMRSHGITNFPDPSGGGFRIPVGGRFNQSPQFLAAQKACQEYLPPGPGSGPPPSAQALAQMLKIAQCMRRHGISDFPDPRTKAPPLGPGIREISNIDGVILVFPTTLDTQSPVFTQAAVACKFPLHNH